MSEQPFTSSDAFRLIHSALGQWVRGAIEDGFDDNPVHHDPAKCWTTELCKMAEFMRDIEGHTDIGPVPHSKEAE